MDCIIPIKRDIKQQILELLKTAAFGRNVKFIAEKLDLSRTTVGKYLSILEQEGEVYDLEVGQYHVFLHKDVYKGKSKINNPLTAVSYALYKSMLRGMAKDLDSKYIKKLGAAISEDFNFTEALNIKNMDELLPQIDFKKMDFNAIATLIMEIIDVFFKVFDEYSWDSPTIMEDKGIIVIRMINSELIRDAPYHFHLISGLIEAEMNRGIQKVLKSSPMNAKVDVLQILPEKKIIDFKLEFDFAL